MKTQINHGVKSITGAVCAGVVLLATISAQAQNLFVADVGSDSVYEFTPSGGQSTFPAGGLSSPIGVAFNGAGNLFILTSGGGYYDEGGISEYTPNGGGLTFGGPNEYPGFDGPSALAFNSAGNLFVANGDGDITEFTANGAESIIVPYVYGIGGMAFNSSGDLFLGQYNGGNNNGNILEITPNGVQSIFATGFYSPDGLAFNGAGNLFVADTTGNIYEITPGGIVSTFAQGFNNPGGIAFDSTGNLFIANTDDGDIIEITPDGSQSVFASGLTYPRALAFQGETLPVPEPSDSGILGIAAVAVVVNRCLRQQKSLT